MPTAFGPVSQQQLQLPREKLAVDDSYTETKFATALSASFFFEDHFSQ